MRHNLCSGPILSISVLLAGLLFQPIAVARQVNKANKAAKAVAVTEVINTLRTAHQLLTAADHDYDGHRALAAREVHKALKELGHRQTNAQTGAAGTAGTKKAATVGQTKGNESQANSDAQLRQAQQLLQGVLPQFGTRHPKAAGNVKAAIGQINAALAIK
jgi:hypothetical protein